MNNIRNLAELYGVTAKTPDSLNIFITEVYSNGYHDGKEFSSAPITLRDHFAGLAMQTLYLSNIKWEPTGEERDEESVSLLKELTHDAYHLADAMLAEREKKDD